MEDIVQIPDYNQRVDLRLQDRGQIRLNAPEALTSTAGIEANAKQLVNAAKDMSDIYLQMKQNRDEGIVNAFMNEFTVARALKMNELKKTYNGANAEGILQAYDDWQKDYFNQRLGTNTDNENMLTLENDEQITAARKAFDDDFASSIDSLSHYTASELDKWENEQKNERLRQLTQDMKNSADMGSFKSKKQDALQTLMDKLSKQELREQAKEDAENERKRKNLSKLMGKLDKEEAQEQEQDRKNLQKLMRQLDKEEQQAQTQSARQQKALQGVLAKIDKDTEKENAAFEKKRKQEEKQQAAIDRAYQREIEKAQNKAEKEALKAQQQAAKDLLKRINDLSSTALATQVNDDILNNPVIALEKLNNPDVINEIGNKNTIRSLKSNAVKAFIDREANRKSDAMMSQSEYEDIDVSAFADVLPYDYQTKINNKAQWLYNTKMKAKKVEEDSVNNQANASLVKATKTLNNRKATQNEIINANELLANARSALGQTERGQTTAVMINDAKIGANEFQTKLQEYDLVMAERNSLIARASEEPDSSISSNIAKYLESGIADFEAEKRTIDSQMQKASEILDNINSDKYSDFNSLGEDIEVLHPYIQNKLFDEFSDNVVWNEFLSRNKGRSATIDAKVKQSFKSVSGVDSLKNPYLYKKFRNGMKDAMINYQVENDGRLPDMNQMLDQSMNVYMNIMTTDTETQSLMDLSTSIQTIQKGLIKENGFASPSIVKQQAREQFEQNNPQLVGNLPDETVDKIIDLVLNGKTSEAEFILGIQND